MEFIRFHNPRNIKVGHLEKFIPTTCPGMGLPTTVLNLKERNNNKATTILQPLFQDNFNKQVTERQNQSGF